jgi:hypothetical protein
MLGEGEREVAPNSGVRESAKSSAPRAARKNLPAGLKRLEILP